jgi:hypothetical protein
MLGPGVLRPWRPAVRHRAGRCHAVTSVDVTTLVTYQGATAVGTFVVLVG